MSTHRTPRGRPGLALLTVVLVGAVLLWLTRPSSDDPAVVNAAVAGEAARPTATAATPSGTARGAAPPDSPLESRPTTPSPPTRLSIPAIGAALRVVPVGVGERGAMVVPDDPATAGWYRYGPGPGEDGATVITAHVDSKELGPGPLARLRDVRAGEVITVTTGEERSTYRVKAVYSAGKEELDVDRLFRREGPPALHVVTCGGDFDPATGHYEDNVIAVAEPLRS